MHCPLVANWKVHWSILILAPTKFEYKIPYNNLFHLNWFIVSFSFEHILRILIRTYSTYLFLSNIFDKSYFEQIRPILSSNWFDESNFRTDSINPIFELIRSIQFSNWFDEYPIIQSKRCWLFVHFDFIQIPLISSAPDLTLQANELAIDFFNLNLNLIAIESIKKCFNRSNTRLTE